MAKVNRITVSAALLRAAFVFAGNKDVRYYLNGVLVEPAPDGHGVRLVATDGHRMAVLFDADGSADAPAIIERHKVPAIPRKCGETLATFDGERATYPGGVSLPVAYIDGRFPDWQAIIPTPERMNGKPAAVNAEYLVDLVAIPKAYGSKAGATLHGNGPDSSALVTFSGLPAFVVQMPLRGDTVCALPDFMRASEPAQLAVALSARAVELESARMRVHALAGVHADDWRHADARAALLRAGGRWVAQVRRCKAAGLTTVQPLAFPADRSAWPQVGTVAADVYPFAVDAFERFDVASPAALVPAALLSPDGRYSCDGCEAVTERGDLVASAAGYHCPDCAGTDDATVPVPAIDSAAPVPAPLVVIRVCRAEGPIASDVWPAGETREFRGPAAWSAAHAALAALCHDAPETGGYDKCDVDVEWANGDTYGYRFDAEHPATPGGQGDTPDVAQHIAERLHFLEGAARPLHMTRAEYRHYIAQAGTQETAAALRAQLERCAFPIELTPPVPVNDEALPVPVPGRRCWYRGYGPGSEGCGSAIVVDVDRGNPPPNASDAVLVRHVRVTVVTDRDGVRRSFSLADLFRERPALILGDTLASDIETTRADLRGAQVAADAASAKADSEQRHVDAVAKLKADHPQLAPASDRNSVGKNMRALLKAAGIRASVTKSTGSMCSSYRVYLPATATDAQLSEAKAIGARFEAGHFDGMTDCYEYRRSAWGDAFGSVRYVFVDRAWQAQADTTPPTDDAGEQVATVDAIEAAPPVPAADPAPVASDRGDDAGATVTDMAAFRSRQAGQREICGTQVPAPAQNSRTRARWDDSAGAWVPVHAAG